MANISKEERAANEAKRVAAVKAYKDGLAHVQACQDALAKAEKAQDPHIAVIAAANGGRIKFKDGKGKLQMHTFRKLADSQGGGWSVKVECLDDLPTE